METTSRALWAALAVVLAAGLLIAPIWMVALPALPDLPAHLAGFYLLAGGVHDAHLAQYYRIDWQFLPNLASEIAVPFLAKFVGLIPATKLFLSAQIALWVLGAAAIQRALFGRVGFAAVPAAFFAYNANFFWGFMNYDFAAGLTLASFAGWIASRSLPMAGRLAAFAAIVTVIYFCHVFAAAALLLLIGTYELESAIRSEGPFWRPVIIRAAGVILIGVPSAACFLLLEPKAADSGHFEFNLLSTWDDRLGGFFEARFDEPGYAVLALLAVFWFAGLWRGWIRLHPGMRTTLIVLALSAVAAPEWAMGGWGVDLRMPAILGAVAFSAAELQLPLRWQATMAVASIAGLAFCAAAAGGFWQYYDRQYAEFRAAIQKSPRGTKIMTALDGSAMGMASDQPYWHMAEFMILDRDGFSSLLFTTAGQHVVRVRPEYRGIAAATAQQGSPPDVGELGDLAAGQTDGDTDIPDFFPYLMRFQCHYDEAVVIRSGGKPSPVPDVLRLRYRGSFFDLYDTRRDDACTES